VTVRRKKGTWGGAREGAGRKPALEDPYRYSMDFERPQIDELAAVAAEEGGSIASVIREAVAQYLARRQRRKRW